MLAKTREQDLGNLVQVIEANIFWVLYLMPCELLAFFHSGWWWVIGIFSTLCGLKALLPFVCPCIYFPAPGCFLQCICWLLVQLTIQGNSDLWSTLSAALSSLVLCIANSINLDLPLSSLWPLKPGLYLLHSSTAPWHAALLGKTLVNRGFTLSIYLCWSSLIAWCPVSWKHLSAFVYCWCLLEHTPVPCYHLVKSWNLKISCYFYMFVF